MRERVPPSRKVLLAVQLAEIGPDILVTKQFSLFTVQGAKPLTFSFCKWSSGHTRSYKCIRKTFDTQKYINHEDDVTLNQGGNHSLVFPRGYANEIFIQSGLSSFSFEDVSKARREKQKFKNKD